MRSWILMATLATGAALAAPVPGLVPVPDVSILLGEGLVVPAGDGYAYALGLSDSSCTVEEGERQALAMASALLSIALDSEVSAFVDLSESAEAGPGRPMGTTGRYRIKVEVLAKTEVAPGDVEVISRRRSGNAVVLLARARVSPYRVDSVHEAQLTLSATSWVAPGNPAEADWTITLASHGATLVASSAKNTSQDPQRLPARGAEYAGCSPSALPMMRLGPAALLPPAWPSGLVDVPEHSTAGAAAIVGAWGAALGEAALGVDGLVDSFLLRSSHRPSGGEEVQEVRQSSKQFATVRVSGLGLRQAKLSRLETGVTAVVQLSVPLTTPPFQAVDSESCNGRPEWTCRGAGLCPTAGLGPACATGQSERLGWSPLTRAMAHLSARARLVGYLESKVQTSITDSDSANARGERSFRSVNESTRRPAAVIACEHLDVSTGSQFALAAQVPGIRKILARVIRPLGQVENDEPGAAQEAKQR